MTSSARRASALLLVALVLGAGVACTGDDDARPGGDAGAPASTGAGSTGAADPVVLCGSTASEPSAPTGSAGSAATDDPATAPEAGAPLEGSLDHLIPAPAAVARGTGQFVVDGSVVLEVADPDAEVAACLLRDELARVGGSRLLVRAVDPGPGTEAGGGDGVVRFDAADPAPADRSGTVAGSAHPEGYRLTTTGIGITIEASEPAGHGWAVQTLLQSAAPEIHSPFVASAPISFPVGTVTDAPRFAWRGLMVDIARHYFGPTDLQRVVDLMAGYKLNVLHLHLTDDQGWRLAIDAYPALTDVGAATEVGGGRGGFLSGAAYRDLVAYAERRGVTVVPEIDLPGHTNAALLAVPDLTCDGVAPDPYTGTSVGFSSLCIGKAEVDAFVRTVLAEVAAMTPGPYLHVGGDEAHSTDRADYEAFVASALDVVRDLGKVPVGWEEVGTVPGDGPLVVQHWLDRTTAEAAARNGASLVLSPSSTLYFDMAYGPFAPDGNSWAGTTDTREVYDWDPLGAVTADPAQILGVEAPLWTELVETPDEIDLRLLPRLPALAEVGWSAQTAREWEGFRQRVATHAARWRAGGRTHVADPGVPWP